MEHVNDKSPITLEENDCTLLEGVPGFDAVSRLLEKIVTKEVASQRNFRLSKPGSLIAN
jgi:hypothetical protein